MKNTSMTIRILILLSIFFRVLVIEKTVHSAPNNSCLLVHGFNTDTVLVDLTGAIGTSHDKNSYESSCKQLTRSKLQSFSSSDCKRYTNSSMSIHGIYYWKGKKYDTSVRGYLSYTPSYYRYDRYGEGSLRYPLVNSTCSVSVY
jgi:hypothetical protein